MRYGKSLLVLLAAALVVAAYVWLSPESVVVYRGGPILTMDSDARVVEALALRGDRIGAVGREKEVLAWAGPGARIVDLEGRALLPGFIDAHSHFPGGGIFARWADLSPPPAGGVENVDQAVAALRKAAERGSDWVVGLGYDDTVLAEQRHLDRDDLDRVSTDRPVAAYHVSGHFAVVNTAGLERLGIDATTPDPEGGRIGRADAAGTPDGLLEETALDSLNPVAMNPGPLDQLAIVREGARRYLAAGVTTAQNGAASETQINGLAQASRLGLIPLRLIVWPMAEVAERIDGGEIELPEIDKTWFRIGAVKLFADGSIQGYTGHLAEPYHTPYHGDADYRGYPRIDQAALREQVLRFHRRGWQIAIHGNGDAAIESILAALNDANDTDPSRDARPVIIHAQMARNDQLDRMAGLGVIPSFFALHVYYWGDRHVEVFLGPERSARISPTASALRRGVRFTLHCDTPVVPMEPLRLVWAAVNRRTASNQDLGLDERISVTDALKAVTINAAYQHFEEDLKGSLEPGKLADLVILSASPLDDPAAIDRLRVVETIVGGRSVYRAEDDGA